jgi:hypothetical protein
MLTIEQRKQALEMAKKNRPNIPNENIKEIILDEYAYQNGTFEQYAYYGANKQDSGMRRDSVGWQDGIRPNAPILNLKEPIRKGCIQIMNDGTQIKTDAPGNYSHFENIKQNINFQFYKIMLIEKIKTTLQPEGRAIATANSFRQFLEQNSSSKFSALDSGMLKASLIYLSRPKQDDEHPAVSARRKTCGEVAALINGNATEINVGAWREWVKYCEMQANTSNDDDRPRWSAMAATAEREYNELRNA